MIPTLTGGGAERQLAYLSRELARRGHEVAVVYSSDGIAPWPNAEVTTIRLASRHRWDPRLVARAVRAIRAFRPDVVQSWIVQMDVIAGIATRLAGTPWVLREPTSAEPYGRTPSKARLRFAAARAGAAAVVANSRGGIEYWEAHAPSVRRVCIPNGVPFGEIDAAQPMGTERPYGLFAGRLDALKNVDVLLEAAHDAGVPLTICGDGPERARLESIATGAWFTGFTTEAWSHMKSAAFVASLSDFEGRPNTVLEAFAARVPVILSDIAAHREIADASCAWLVPLRDVPATAAAMGEILAGGPAIAAKVEEARRRVEAFSIEAMTDAFEALYEDVIR